MFFRNVVPTAKAPPTGAPNVITRLPNWLRSAFGLQSGELPSILDTPRVLPVVDVYQPIEAVQLFADPAVGAEASFVVPGANLEYRDWTLFFLLTTDGTVTNRRVTVRVDRFIQQGGFVPVYQVGSNFDQPASIAAAYSLGAQGVVGNTGVAATPIVMLPLPVGFYLRAGDRIVTVTTNRQAGDQFGGGGAGAPTALSGHVYQV